MKKFHLHKLFLSVFLSAFSCFYISAESYFSGFAGAVTDLHFYDKTAEPESASFDPELNFNLFFNGQYSFGENVITRMEFSLKTGDLLSGSIFHEVDSKFQIDEISVIFRRQLGDVTNYLSAFMGTYEPIGSDIFLRRQFGIKPIASKITNTWQGIKGSVLNSHFGVGGADVIQLAEKPIAFGLYVYVNDEEGYVLNSDLRFACVYRYFTFDTAAGVGLPMNNNSKTSDSLFSIDKLYWRAGANMLIGNTQTTSLFIQGGISDVPFTREDKSFAIDDKTTYLLFEPRFKAKTFQVDVTAFSLPQSTVNQFLFINDTLGLNLHIFTDNLYIKNHIFTFGIHSALTFPEKTFRDFEDFSSLFDDYKITIAPYTQFRFISGELNLMLQCRVTDYFNNTPAKAISVNVGYKTQF